MSDVLISTDASKLQNLRNDYSIIAGKFQQIVTAYNVLGLTALTNDNLAAFLADPETFAATAIVGDAVINGVSYNVVNLLRNNIVVKPAGYDALLSNVAAVRDFLNPKNPHNGLIGNYTYGSMIQYFQLNDSGNVVIKPSRDAALVIMCNSYATSTTAKNMITLGNSILSQLSSLNLLDIQQSYPNGLGAFIEQMIYSEKRTGTGLNGKGILKYN